jgi:transcription antitermination factor NusG
MNQPIAFSVNAAWYALSVKPRHEKVATSSLQSKGLEVFNPLYTMRRRWSDRIKDVEVTLFPGYVFCRFGFERRMSVLCTPSVTSIVCVGKQAVPISNAEIAAIQAIVASGRSVAPCPYISPGHQVKVITGCLEGVFGTVVRVKGSCRVVVSIELLQRSVAVEVDFEDLQPAALAAVS